HTMILTSRPAAATTGEYTLAVVISPLPLSEQRRLQLSELAENDQFTVVTAPPDRTAAARESRVTLSPRQTRELAAQHGVDLGPVHDNKPYPGALAQFRLDPVGTAFAGGAGAIQAVPASAREPLERLRAESRSAALALVSSRLGPLILALLFLSLALRSGSTHGPDSPGAHATIAFLSAGAALGAAELFLRPLGWPGALGPALFGAAALGAGVALSVARIRLVGSLTLVVGWALSGMGALALLGTNQPGGAPTSSLLAPVLMATLAAALGGAGALAVTRRLTYGAVAGLTGLLALAAGFVVTCAAGALLAPLVGHTPAHIVAFGGLAASAGIAALALVHFRNRSAPLRNHRR
ncbi:MAG TPA: hypothetical protein VLB27_05140, partial [candidate division Zixibacteria bacterium]|nr:hypothetical protein [candidate division Zixibacteria bacterium]